MTLKQNTGEEKKKQNRALFIWYFLLKSGTNPLLKQMIRSTEEQTYFGDLNINYLAPE